MKLWKKTDMRSHCLQFSPRWSKPDSPTAPDSGTPFGHRSPPTLSRFSRRTAISSYMLICCASDCDTMCTMCLRLWSLHTSSTAQGGGGSFKNRKPIGEVGCCESGMAERSHWWTERCLRSPLCLSLSLTIYLPTYLSIHRSIYLSIHLSMYLCIYLSIDLSLSLSLPSNYLSIYLSICLSVCLSISLSLSFICLSV